MVYHYCVLIYLSDQITTPIFILLAVSLIIQLLDFLSYHYLVCLQSASIVFNRSYLLVYHVCIGIIESITSLYGTYLQHYNTTPCNGARLIASVLLAAI